MVSKSLYFSLSVYQHYFLNEKIIFLKNAYIPKQQKNPCRYRPGTVQSGLTPCTVPQDLNGVVPGPCAITLDPQIGTNIVPMLEHIMNVLD